jgi:hypothetical protein
VLISNPGQDTGYLIEGFGDFPRTFQANVGKSCRSGHDRCHLALSNSSFIPLFDVV